jgi:hypothetical protein
MHVKEIYVIFIHLFDSGKLLIIDLNKKKGKKGGGILQKIKKKYIAKITCGCFPTSTRKFT